MPNTLKLTATDDGRIKVRVQSPSERDQSAVVTFDELQEMIRSTQVGDEAELPLEPDDPSQGQVPDPAPVDPGPSDYPDAPPDDTQAVIDANEPPVDAPEPPVPPAVDEAGEAPDAPAEAPAAPDATEGDATEAEVDLSQPVEGEPQVGVDAPAESPVPADPTGDVPEEQPPGDA